MLQSFPYVLIGDKMILRALLFLTAFLPSILFAQEGTCAAKKSAEMQAVFAQAVKINDDFKHSAAAPADMAKYKALRAKVEEYDEENTLPCVEAAAKLVVRSPDKMLARSLLALVAAYENSADESISYSVAQFFVGRPAMFRDVLRQMPPASQCAVLGRLGSGWNNLKHETEAKLAMDRELALRKLTAETRCGVAG